jgi:hypothetical protein
LCKNFNCITKHNCFEINIDKILKNENESGILSKSQSFSTEESHLCRCNFFLNLLRIADKTLDTKVKVDRIFMTFLKSYKFKFLYGFSYLSIYDIVMFNGSEYVKQFAVQVITVEDISERICLMEEFLLGMFEKLENLTRHYLSKQQKGDTTAFKTLFEIIFEFYMDIYYLCKPRTAKILSKNNSILKSFINVLALFHNRNSFQQATSFQYEGYQDVCTDIELFLLKLFSLLTTTYDYSNITKSDDILFYLIDTIRSNERYIQLADNQFSFHISLNRALAIFLLRYAYFISNNSDLHMGVKQILLKYYYHLFSNKEQSELSELSQYTYENLLSDILKNTLKYLGFINSIHANYWVNYGENMLYFHHFYYINEIFYLSDFSLLKMILSQDSQGTVLSLQNFLTQTCLINSYEKVLQTLISKKEYIETEDNKAATLFAKNLETFVHLCKTDIYLLDLLAYSLERIKGNKNEDQLLNIVYQEDKKHLLETLKIRLIHSILYKENNIYYSEIKKSLPYYIKELFTEQEIESILNEICDKMKNKNNKPVSFKLKNEYISEFDVAFTMEGGKKTNAQKYLMEFKKNDISLINTSKILTLTSIKSIDYYFLLNFSNNEDNMNLCRNLLYVFFSKAIHNHNYIPPIKLVFHLMKIMCIINVELNLSNNDKSLVDLLKQCSESFTDEHMKNACSYLHNLMKSKFTITDDIIIDLNPGKVLIHQSEIRKNKAKAVRERLFKKFQTRTYNIKKRLGLIKDVKDSNITQSTMDITESSVLEMADSNFLVNLNLPFPKMKEEKCLECVYCHIQMNTSEFFSKPFGRIGIVSSSSFLYNSKLQTMKKEYEKIVKQNEESNILTNHLLGNENSYLLKELMLTFKRSKPELKKSLRFTTCNHAIHFSCYQSLVVKFNYEGKHDIIFVCPFCKTISNTFIPHIDFNSLALKEVDNYENSLLKGITFAELFSFYKEILSRQSTEKEINLNMFQLWNQDFSGLETSTLVGVSLFIEKIVGEQLKESFLIKDFSKKQENQLKYYEAMKLFFINSLSLFDTSLTNEDSVQKQLSILKEYVLSLRLLIKSKLIDPQIFFKRLLEILFYHNTNYVCEEQFSYNIETDKVSIIFSEVIFLILVLFDDSEFHYLNIIFKHLLPLLAIQYFVLETFIAFNFKTTKQNFEEKFIFSNFLYVINNPEMEERLKGFLNFYLKKIVLVKDLFKDKLPYISKETSNISSTFNFYITQLGFTTLQDLLKKDENMYPSFWTFREDITEITTSLFNRFYESKLKEMNSLTEGIILF